MNNFKFTERQMQGLRLASEAYNLAFRLNGLQHFDGTPCQAAFDTARACVNRGFAQSGVNVEMTVAFVHECILETSEYDIEALMRWASAAIASQLEEAAASAVTRDSSLRKVRP